MKEPACSPAHPSRRRWIEYVFARLLKWTEGPMARCYGGLKNRLYAPLGGTVLEIGAGTGANLPYYPRGISLIALEPNPYMHRHLRGAAGKLGLDLRIEHHVAEGIPLEDASVDWVVGTLVLCSVHDPTQVLGEVLRVLKPGGRYIFLEHVAAPRGTFRRGLQDIVLPPWRFCADGCHTNRETWTMLESAGFRELEIEHHGIWTPFPFIHPHIAGVAVR